ncbi:hypothetical protein ACFS07_34400 [Undibacterium arcticum]
MSTLITVATDNFRIELDDTGVAHVIFQSASGMPVTDAAGHGALASIWRTLNVHPKSARHPGT